MKATVEGKEPGTISSTNGAPAAATMLDVQNPVSVKNILVPLDFSLPAMQALDYANALAKQLGAHIHLMHVEMPDEASPMPEAGHLMRESAASATLIHEKLGGMEQECAPRFWPENCHVRTGHPYEEICKLARELNVDLIVLASRGNTGLKRIVLGSTAERVVRFAPCPVLVVRQRKGKAPRRQLVIRKILAPVDFSQCSISGVMYAAFLAEAFNAKLCLFHAIRPRVPVVLDGVRPTDEDRLSLENARLDMEALSELDFLRDMKPSAELRIGYPVEAVCGETTKPDVELVVMSSHGRSGFNRMLLGSVAEHVVRYAQCPVMVIPSRARNLEGRESYA